MRNEEANNIMADFNDTIDSTDVPEKDLNGGAIAGIAISVLIALLLVIAIVVSICRYTSFDLRACCIQIWASSRSYAKMDVETQDVTSEKGAPHQSDTIVSVESHDSTSDIGTPHQSDTNVNVETHDLTSEIGAALQSDTNMNADTQNSTSEKGTHHHSDTSVNVETQDSTSEIGPPYQSVTNVDEETQDSIGAPHQSDTNVKVETQDSTSEIGTHHLSDTSVSVETQDSTSEIGAPYPSVTNVDVETQDLIGAPHQSDANVNVDTQVSTSELGVIRKPKVKVKQRSSDRRQRNRQVVRSKLTTSPSITLNSNVDIHMIAAKEVGVNQQPGEPSCREMITDTETSTSTSAGIPPQDASADGAVSSSKASEHVDPGISEMELHNLAEKLGNHTNLHKFALKLGFKHERWMRYIASNTRRDGRIGVEGTFDMLIDWQKKTPKVSQKALLNEALIFAGFAEIVGDQEPSRITDQTGKADRNTDVYMPKQDISPKLDLVKDNKKDSGKELHGKDEAQLSCRFYPKATDMAGNEHRINIGVLSLVWDKSIEHPLMSIIRTCKTEVQFICLSPTDLKVYMAPVHLNAVILLHPQIEGRLSLTDVTDARYTNLLPALSEQYGRDSICVIAYLVRNLKEHTYQTRLQMMKSTQPTVFEMSSCVVLCGKLEDIFHHDLERIKRFVKNQWERIAGQPWHDSWFQPSNETQRKDTTRAVLKPADEENKMETQTGPDSQAKIGTALQRFGYTSFREARINLRKNMQEADSKPFWGSLGEFFSSLITSTPSELPAVLVTNASGFVASHIVMKLLDKGYKVHATLGKHIPSNDTASLVEEDVSEADRLKKKIRGCTYVIHTADLVLDRADKFTDDKMTTSGVVRLLDACVDDGGVKRVIVAGSCDFVKSDFSKNRYSTKEWANLDSTLKDAYWKALTEKEALQFGKRHLNVGPKISFIKSPVVMGPICFPVVDAKEERARCLHGYIEARDINFPMCDVRDVAEAFTIAIQDGTAEDVYASVTHQVFRSEEMRKILKKDFGKAFKKSSFLSTSTNETSKALTKLYSNKTPYVLKKNRPVLVNSPIPMETTVTDMVQSYVNRNIINLNY